MFMPGPAGRPKGEGLDIKARIPTIGDGPVGDLRTLIPTTATHDGDRRGVSWTQAHRKLAVSSSG